MRIWSTAAAMLLLMCASHALADDCWHFPNNPGCDSQNAPSDERTPSAARPTGLREQLQRRLAEPTERSGPTQAELKERIDEAAKPVTAVLEHRDAPDAQQRYNEAMAGFRKATEETAAAADSPALRAALIDYARALGITFEERARTLYNPATGIPPSQAEMPATAEPPIQVGDVGVDERGLVFVCGQYIDGVNLSCREIQDDGRQCRAVIVTNGDVVWRDSAITECSKADLQKRDAFLATLPKDQADAIPEAPSQPQFAMDQAGTDAEISRYMQAQERLLREQAMNKAAQAAQQPRTSGNQTSNSAQPRNNVPQGGQASPPNAAPVIKASTITGAKFGDVAGTAPAGNLGAAPTGATVAFAVPQPQGPATPAVHDSTGASASLPTIRTPTVAVRTPVIRTPDVTVNTPVVRTPDVTVYAPAVRTPNPPRINTPRIDAPNATGHTPGTAAPSISMDAACQNLVGNYIAAAQAQDGPASQAAYEALSAAGGCGVLAQAEAQAKAEAQSQAAAADPRFVARGDTPMLDQTVAQCDRLAAACAEVVRQLRAGTSPAAVAAMYANAISIGLQLGAAAGQGVLNASHTGAVRVPSRTSSNMSSIGNRPVSSTYGQGSPLHPAPPSGQSTITFPGQ
jgi:hypothetical protein